MRIVELTPTRLTLKHQPIGAWLSGATLFLGGLVFLSHSLLFTTAAARMTCQRSPVKVVQCELRRTNLVGFTKTIRLTNPYSVDMSTRVSSRGSRSYEIWISSPTARVSFLGQSGGAHNENHRILNALQEFILSDRPEITVQMNVRQLRLFMGLLGLSILATGIFLGIAPVTLCTFYNQVLHKVTIERRGLRGSLLIEYPIEKIAGIEIEEQVNRQGKTYRPVLVLTSQARVPITPEFTREHLVRSVVFNIEQFLNKSQEEPRS